MELYLIRHGETAGDPHQICEPPVEGYLSERGVVQSLRLAEALRDTSFDHIFASPLGRAIQTAQPLAGLAGRPIQVLPWLKEWQPATVLGRCDETQWEEIERAASLLRPEMAWSSGAGESSFEFAHRIVPNFLQLMLMLGAEAAHGGYLLTPEAESQRIAIVAHGGTNTRLTSFLLGVPFSPYGPFSFAHTGVAVFEFQRRVDVWYPVLRIPAFG